MFKQTKLKYIENNFFNLNISSGHSVTCLLQTDRTIGTSGRSSSTGTHSKSVGKSRSDSLSGLLQISDKLGSVTGDQSRAEKRRRVRISFAELCQRSKFSDSRIFSHFLEHAAKVDQHE